ncbi:alpha/beta hydrolase [Arthrobacter pityocampae]|uniref:alpha/beta hydrolase n=1 Tax=Arthrobacter pityocampae TaxID=547334 RepID=UPI003734C3B4
MLHRVPAVCAAVALTLTPLWLVGTNPSVARAHPLLPGLLAAACVLGLVIAWRTVRSWRRPPRPGRRRPVLASLAALLAIGSMAALAWLAPFPFSNGTPGAAQGFALAGVDYREDATSITLTPVTGSVRGFIFYPGARVEALAYVPLLARVAQEGTTVVVLKEPLGISLLDSGQARSAMRAYPDLSVWAVGGHSLGGVSASVVAPEDDAVDGLVLWASYPLEDLSGSDLEVLSVSGAEDGLTTRADVEASRARLPAGTSFVEVPGAVHAFFGDYGEQPGDGTATTDRKPAQEIIVDATVQFLASLE